MDALFSCEICNRTFKTADYLRRHQKTKSHIHNYEKATQIAQTDQSVSSISEENSLDLFVLQSLSFLSH